MITFVPFHFLRSYRQVLILITNLKDIYLRVSLSVLDDANNSVGTHSDEIAKRIRLTNERRGKLHYCNTLD